MLLDRGIEQVTDMIVQDFSDAGRLEWDRDNRKQFVRLKDRGFPGLAIRQEADYVWVRNGKFDAQVLQGWQPLDGSIVAAAASPVAASAPAAPAVIGTNAEAATTPLPVGTADGVAPAPAAVEAAPAAPAVAPAEAAPASTGGNE